MNGWSLVYEGFDPARERLREALCTLGNGYFATRGAVAESDADPVHYPGTYLAGGYDRLVSEVAGERIENEDLVNFPSWLPLRVRVEDGAWFRPEDAELLAYRQELDLRRGLLLRDVRFRDPAGRVTRLSFRRFVHMRYRHLAGEELRIEPEGWSGHVTVRSGIDGNVENTGVARYLALARRHVEPLRVEACGDDAVLVEVRTCQSGIRVAEVARTRVTQAGEPVAPERRLVVDRAFAAHELTLPVRSGEATRLEKVVALFSSRDVAVSEPSLSARHAVEARNGFDELAATHVLEWRHLWARCELDLQGADEHTDMALRLHVFHILQTTSMHTVDVDAGIPARGLHGEAYRGHVFWDELFVFPFLNLRMPALARALMRYRHRRLDRARGLAREAGAAGALFPWQSGSDGREESQRLHLNPRSGRWIADHTLLQRHITSAVAYNVWHYQEVTGDTQYLHDHGAEVLLEIARFWATYATHDPVSGRFHVRGVVGPDEFHTAYPGADRPGIDDNAYTNVMAAWCLLRGLDALRMLPDGRVEELKEKLHLDDAELEHWRHVSRALHVPFHQDGVISQFEGYDALQELDLGKYRLRYGDVSRIDRILEAENDTPNRYKISKQADVLMLLYLLSSDELRELLAHLGYAFDPSLIPRIVGYYGRRTTHGSTLSRVVYSWVLARSDRRRSWRLFTLALDSDIGDVQGGTTPEGIHLGAMGGTVDLVQRGYTGLESREGVLRFSPRLPRQIQALRLRLRYRGHPLLVELSPSHLHVRSRWKDAAPVTVVVGEEERVVQGGGQAVFDLGRRLTPPRRPG